MGNYPVGIFEGKQIKLFEITLSIAYLNLRFSIEIYIFNFSKFFREISFLAPDLLWNCHLESHNPLEFFNIEFQTQPFPFNLESTFIS